MSLLTLPLKKLRPAERDARVREILGVKAEGDPGNVELRLDFNARLVTALREEKLWPPR